MAGIFTNETLKELAVDTVERFVNEGTPLAEGISSIASSEMLNKEQTRRLIETTNSLAYLKLLASSKDRTFEFPVASFEEVMARMTGGLDKVAGVALMEKAAAAIDFAEECREAALEKMASLKFEGNETIFFKSAISLKSEFEKTAFDMEEIKNSMDSVIGRLRKDPQSLEKLAEVCTETEYAALSAAVSTDTVLVKIAAAQDHVFRKSELSDAERFAGLYKEAKILTERRKVLAETLEKVAKLDIRPKAPTLAEEFKKPTSYGTALKKLKMGPMSTLTTLAGGLSVQPSAEQDVWSNLQPKAL